MKAECWAAVMAGSWAERSGGWEQLWAVNSAAMTDVSLVDLLAGMSGASLADLMAARWAGATAGCSVERLVGSWAGSSADSDAQSAAS